MELATILPIVATIASAVGAYAAAWLKFSGSLASVQAELAKVKAEAEASKRDDRRDDFAANLSAYRDRAVAAEAKSEATALELVEYKGRTDARMDALERENLGLRREAQGLRRELDTLIHQRCPWGRQDCPREHKPVQASAV